MGHILGHLSFSEAAQRIRDGGIVAIARGGFTLSKACELADALRRGGVWVVEVTRGSETALECIRHSTPPHPLSPCTQLLIRVSIQG